MSDTKSPVHVRTIRVEAVEDGDDHLLVTGTLVDERPRGGEKWFGVEGPRVIHQDVHRALARHLDKERTALLLAWLRTPLSRRIVALESAASSTDRAAEETAFVNQLPSALPKPARLALVHRADRAGEMTETSAVVIGATIGALRKTVALVIAPGAMPRGAPDPRDIVPAVDEMFRFRAVVSLLFAYRDLRDAELDRYAAFLESPTGCWFTRVTRQALVDSLQTPQPPLATPTPTRRH
jgi:hypothetical protein